MAGKDHSDYYYVKWSAYATLNGDEIPLVGLKISYILDQVPEAELILAVGREPTSNEEAKAAAAFLEARPYSKVEIYIKGETEMDSPLGKEEPGFPFDEDVLVFEGYLEGTTYGSARSPAGGSVGLSASCVGWLGALGGSSSSTQKNTVKGPGGFDEILNLGKEQGIFDITNTFGIDISGTTSNLWTDFIKQLFLAIVNEPKVWGEASNQSALDALTRMDKTGMLGDKASTDLTFPVANAGVSDKDIQQFLSEQIGKVIYGVWRNSDMWTALTTMAELFTFSIVPVIDTAFCAPIIAALGGEVYTTIKADEYWRIDISARAQANVTRVAVIDANNSTSNPRDAEVKLSAVLGLAELEGVLNPGDNSLGVTVELKAPYWLAPSTAIGEYTRIGLGGDKLAIPDAVNPDAFVDEPDEQYNEIYSNYITSQVGDDYAKLMLQNLFLANRRGSIVGRFRLDIAPGSTIAFEVIEDKFGEASAEPKTMVALVNGVNIVLDSGSAGTPTAHTSLSLTHVRTAQEHSDDRITSVIHQIYQSRFAGTKLWSE